MSSVYDVITALDDWYHNGPNSLTTLTLFNHGDSGRINMGSGMGSAEYTYVGQDKIFTSTELSNFQNQLYFMHSYAGLQTVRIWECNAAYSPNARTWLSSVAVASHVEIIAYTGVLGIRKDATPGSYTFTAEIGTTQWTFKADGTSQSLPV